MAEKGKGRIRIREDQPYKKLGDLFGIFFEDINHAADGGLYAELVAPRTETQELTADQKTVTWRFAPHSVTVLKLLR